MKHLIKFNEKKSNKEIRIERDGKGYSFIEIIDGDLKKAKNIQLSLSQRESIEKLLNK